MPYEPGFLVASTRQAGEPAAGTGGLNLAHLSDEQQIEAEDDYRICVRRGSTEKAKPKRNPRRIKSDSEHEEES